MTFAEMEGAMKKAGAKMDSQMAGLEEKLKGLPPEQREKMEKMMGGSARKDAKVEVQGPGERKTISGYACASYKATADGKMVFTSWTTKDVKGFDGMKKDWQDAARRLASMNPMAGKGMGEAFAKIDGFPIQMEMNGGIITTVTKIEQRSALPAEFEVPAGYAKVDSPLLQMGK